METSASAVAVIMSLFVLGVITSTTGTIAMEPAYKIGIHATRLVSLDTISAKNTKEKALTTNTSVTDALKKVALMKTSSIAMTATTAPTKQNVSTAPAHPHPPSSHQ